MKYFFTFNDKRPNNTPHYCYIRLVKDKPDHTIIIETTKKIFIFLKNSRLLEKVPNEGNEICYRVKTT